MNEPPEFWPPFDYRDTRSIAAFVSPRAVLEDDRLRLSGSVRGRYEQAESAESARRLIAREQYDKLRSHRIPYDHEPFTCDDRQLIRDPQLVLDETGTCLDLAVLYAAMSLVGRVAPYVAFTELLSGSHHAFVVLDLRRDLSGDAVEVPRPFSTAATQGGVHRFDVDRSELANGLEAGRLLAVDATVACLEEAAPWDSACRAGTNLLAGGRWVELVDVVSAHAASEGPVEALTPPRYRRAIRRYAPLEFTDFVDYPSRKAAIARLRDGGAGRLVVTGAQGLGKSRLAREVVGGNGWFLNASSKESLVRELATAELRELGQRLDDLEIAEANVYADNARARLERADGPWRVVFDNANGPPGEILPLLPAADAAKGQSVIVTTTNSAWGEVPGYEVVETHPLAADELPAGLGDETGLANLIGGRALLVTAFQRLLEETGWTTSELGRRAAQLLGGGTGSELDGPGVLWGLVTALETFAMDDREVAYRLAWLPADDLNADVVAAIHPAGIDSARKLARWGLLDESEDAARFSMHRLVGTVLRDEQADSAIDRLIGLLQLNGVVDALGERGEREAIDRIVDGLLFVDDSAGPDPRLGRALAAVGGISELHGDVDRSANLYGRAIRHLDASDERDRPLLATCLHGNARWTNQHATERSEFERALEQIVGSISMREQDDDHIGAARGRAMQSLLVQKLADFTQDEHERLRIFRDAMTIIDQSHADRLEASASAVEVARAQFNKGGVRVNLAQTDDPRLADRYLLEAEEAYREVLTARRRLYTRSIHPHIAACLSGLALTAYYRAILLKDASPAQRGDWLRDATTHGTEAVQAWQHLDGRLDGGEVAKSAALLAKIALARQAFVAARSKAPTFGPVRGGMERFVEELERAEVFAPGAVKPPPPGAPEG